jgi:hypothetical protein
MPRRGGRPERPVSPGAPYADVAVALRGLKGRSGLSYREIATATGYPMSALAEAARGRRMPRLDLLRAFVAACGGQGEEREDQWDELVGRVRLPGQVRLSPGLTVPLPATTRRELDVLASLCGRRPSGGAFAAPAAVREMAAHLAVTEAAVKQHLRKLYEKFDVPAGPQRRVRLANAVVACGLLTPAKAGGRPDGASAPAARSAREHDWEQAHLLARRNDPSEAARVLLRWADDGDGYAARLLAGLLAGQGDLAGLRARADGGDSDARLLAGLLAGRGDAAGDSSAGDGAASAQRRRRAEHDAQGKAS